MDFMNLNQSAHGDREFGFIETRMRLRRKTVVGHWQRPVRARPDRHLVAGSVRLARGADAQRRALRRQHAARRRDRGRQGRGAAPARCRGARLRRRRAGRRGTRRPGLRRSTGWSTSTSRTTTLVPALREGRRAPGVAAGRRANRGGAAGIPRGGRLQGIHRHFRGPRRPAAAARHRRAAPDGGRLRVRGGGRLEDRGSRPHRQGDERRARRAARRSWRTTRTTSAPERPEGARRAHARGLPVDRGREAVVRDPPALDRRQAGPGTARVHRRARGRPWSVGLLDLGDRFRLVANEVEVVPPDEELPRLPVARAVWEPKPDLATAAEAWLLAGGPHHTSFCSGARHRGVRRSRRDRRAGAAR